MANYRLTLAMATHRGKKRPHNEDAIAYHYPSDFDSLFQQGVLLVLADGVGGMENGEQASAYAVQRLTELYYQMPAGIDAIRALTDAITQVNAEVYRTFVQESATTLVAVVIRQAEATIAHVGDSRLYWLNGQMLRQMTQDHTAPTRTMHNRVKHKLTRAIGRAPHINVAISVEPIGAHDNLLLVSDGVTKYLGKQELARYMTLAPSDCVRKLIYSANERGGRDNISAISAQVGAMIEDEGALREHLANMTVAVALDEADTLEESAFTWQIVTMTVILISIILGGMAFSLSFGQAADEVTTAPTMTETALSEATQVLASATMAITATASTTAISTTATLSPDVLLPQRWVIVDEVTVTYTEIDGDTSAFLLVPNRAYRIEALYIDDNDLTWVQFYDEETERSGWISERSLPSYIAMD